MDCCGQRRARRRAGVNQHRMYRNKRGMGASLNIFAETGLHFSDTTIVPDADADQDKLLSPKGGKDRVGYRPGAAQSLRGLRDNGFLIGWDDQHVNG